MIIYIIQSYDRLCSTFNPYVIAFEIEDDAIRHIKMFEEMEKNMMFSYVPIFLNKKST